MTEAAPQPERPGTQRYSAVAIVLHWLIAALIVLQVTLASRMGGPHTPESFAVTQLHKSVGITVLLLSLARLGWRLAHPAPPLPASLAPWERRVARFTHAALYGVMIGMPLTGWIMVSASRIALPTRLYGVVPWPMIPGLPELAPHAKAVWRAVGEGGHKLIIRGAYVLVALHVAGALKHQLFSRDEPVLAHMAPGAVPGRRAEWRLGAIALAAVAVVAFGLAVRPPLPQLAPGPALAATPAPAPVPVAPAAVAPPSVAPTTNPAPPPSTLAEPVRWTVLPSSRLAFESAWSGQAVRGVFRRWRAEILFSPLALDRSRVSVTVDTASIDTGDAQRDATLPSEDWFDTAAHPKAVFTANRFSRAGADRYIAHGRLELRGVTRPLDLPFRLALDGDHAEARGGVSLDRTVFGVGQGDFAATDQIPADVAVSLDVKARAAR